MKILDVKATTVASCDIKLFTRFPHCNDNFYISCSGMNRLYLTYVDYIYLSRVILNIFYLFIIHWRDQNPGTSSKMPLTDGLKLCRQTLPVNKKFINKWMQNIIFGPTGIYSLRNQYEVLELYFYPLANQIDIE